MRAHRPGRVGSDEFDEDFQRQRQEKIAIYTRRARQRLPLFEVTVSPAPAVENVVNSLHP